MYLTLLTKSQYKQYTFEDLLNDPFASLENIPTVPQKKVTVEIDEDYGRQLYNKRYKGLYLPDMSWTDSLITDECYTKWKKRKRNGKGYRQLCGPTDQLKIAQRIYKAFIEDNLRVLNHKAAHAYTKKRSVVTNIDEHKKNKSKWVLALDLKDFFDSINENWLRKMLLEVYPFKYIPEEEFNRIVRLSLFEERTPQGSVLSPTLTNIVMVPIDHAICEALHNYNKHHYVYTRYADDMTISCKEKFNPQEIIEIVKSIFEKWEAPFTLKETKTKFMSVNGACYICGINLNYDKNKDVTQLSLGHEKNNRFRAMINSFCLSGEEWDIKDIQKMLGLISYFKSVEKPFVVNTIAKYNAKYNIDIMAKAKALINGKNYSVEERITGLVMDNPDTTEIPF